MNRAAPRSKPLAAFGTISTALAALMLNGCASLDPTDDVTSAASAVQQRTGATPAWLAPLDPSARWDGVQPLTEKQAVAMALAGNSMLRAEVESIAAARADLVQAGLLPNPMLKIAFGVPVGDEMAVTSYSVALVQQFATLLTRPARLREADAALRAQVLRASDRALALAAEVRSLHAAAVCHDRATALAERRAQVLGELASFARARHQVGEGTVIDVGMARTAAAQAEVDLAVHRAERAAAMRQLLEAIGMAAADADFTVAEHTDDPIAAAGAMPTEDSMIALAVTQRLDVAVTESLVTVAAERAGIAATQRIPAVTAGPAIERDMSGTRGIGAMIDIEPRLFDSGEAAQTKANSEYRRARLEAEAARQAAIAKVRMAWQDVATRRLPVFRARYDAVDALSESLAARRTALQTGEGSRESVLAMEAELLMARDRLIEDELALRQAWIGLELAAGGTLERLPPLTRVSAAPRKPAAPE